LNLRKEAENCDDDWLFGLRYKECPEYMIEMIESKLDENNLEESKIKELWKDNVIQNLNYVNFDSSFEFQMKNQNSLADKLNKIISKLNKRDSEYYDYYDLNEYNLIL
jgi:hypothetical protein